MGADDRGRGSSQLALRQPSRHVTLATLAPEDVRSPFERLAIIRVRPPRANAVHSFIAMIRTRRDPKCQR
jgi:hypothetical protein